MRTLFVTGQAAITSSGVSEGALSVPAGGYPKAEVNGMYEQPLPSTAAHALPGFNVVEHLGRKGTSFYDRATALAVVACGAALRDAGVPVTEDRPRTGVVLGTTVGSFKSTSDFSLDTLVQPKPYMVNPVLFPNTVMNGAAGQVAIRHRLTGVNATVATGPMALLHALRYAAMVIDRGYADEMVVGVAEEFTPHRAWSSDDAGEAAAVFVVGSEPAGAFAEILAVATGFAPSGQDGDALRACVARAVRASGRPAELIKVQAVSELSDGIEADAAYRALGHRPRVLSVSQGFGDCGAAQLGVALAAIIGLHQENPAHDGELALITATSRDGAVGAAVVRGWKRGPDRG